MKILVTGNMGYIGAITAKELEQAGYEVVGYDLKQGQDINDKEKLKKTIKENQIEAVMHFAAYISMGESMENPGKYFANNFSGSISLLEAMRETGVKKMIFSSSAGVYGNPLSVPIKEDAAKNPENPYGESKLMVEKALGWYDKSSGIKSIAIRYFNAAGAVEGMGENHQPESHLIPNVIDAAINGKSFSLFGDDYPTTDGTCVRDYIHVLDLASAHIAALKALEAGKESTAYNAGTGIGYSNKEVIAMVEKVSGKKIAVEVKPRRPGDAAELVADSSKLRQELAWEPKLSDLENIVKSAYSYHTIGGNKNQ